MTFGPGLLLYLVPITALLTGGWLVYGWQRSLPAADDAFDSLLGMVSVLVLIIVPIGTWARYRLDAEGIERQTLNGRRRWPWEAIGGVRGQRFAVRSGYRTRWVVLDLEGRELFRVSVWTRKRRELAREIRRRAAGVPPS